jgi:16S rRNA (uracil1498-N3)-methyltransferase
LADTVPGGPAATVYLAGEAFAGDRAEVGGDLYRHLFRARRTAVGERLRAVDGHGRARWAAVAAVRRDGAVLQLGEELATVEPSRRVTLIGAAPRPERASWLVEKATELGVEAIVWLRSERAPRRLGAGVLERHRRVAIGAMQQCGGARLPRLAGPIEWDSLAAELAEVEAAVVLDPAAPGGARVPDSLRCAVVIGPEGGWTEAERDHLGTLGCLPWSLGPRVLRIETAAVVAAALLVVDAPS